MMERSVEDKIFSVLKENGEREGRVVHVRFEGRSQDIAFATLDIGDISSDDDVKLALASYLDVAVNKFADYAVERHQNGNFTVRPEAVFG